MGSSKDDIMKMMRDKAAEIDRQEEYRQKAAQNFQKKPRAVRRFERTERMLSDNGKKED